MDGHELTRPPITELGFTEATQQLAQHFGLNAEAVATFMKTTLFTNDTDRWNVTLNQDGTASLRLAQGKGTNFKITRLKPGERLIKLPTGSRDAVEAMPKDSTFSLENFKSACAGAFLNNARNFQQEQPAKAGETVFRADLYGTAYILTLRVQETKEWRATVWEKGRSKIIADYSSREEPGPVTLDGLRVKLTAWRKLNFRG